MIKKILVLITLIIAKITIPLHAQSNEILWYDQPAIYFEEALALGNGKMGAMVFGGVSSDKIYLNDITLWSGEPVNPYNNPEAYKYVEQVRKALDEGDYKKADSLNRFIQGEFTQSYAPLGTMNITFQHKQNYTDYYRELDLGKAISKTRYKADGVKFQREYFISHPDQIMTIKLTASKKGTIHCSIGFESLLKYTFHKQDDVLEVHGYAPCHAEPSYRGDLPDAVVFDENRGTRFTTLFKVKNKAGQVTVTDSSIELSGCDEAEIYISVATSFNGFDKNPVTLGADNRKLAVNSLKHAMGKPYDVIRQDHIKDYQSLFNRVKLDLGNTKAPDLPTNKRLMRYSTGNEDKNLEILYFNFGRYLLISSSRTRNVPANLQGLWNPYIRPPWSSNYTININLQENYWLAEIANLSELHRPLLGFIEKLSMTGAVTAKTYYGTGGWAAGHNSDIWATSNPVGDFGEGSPSWANWNMGGVWLSTHLWEHYVFTKDIEFLKNEAFPIMEGAVQFCLEWMVKDKKGKWITSPGTSPENIYLTPEGYAGATLYGVTADLAMIRELLGQYIRASEEPGVEAIYAKQAAERLANLHPYSIGKKGNLQEWYYDWDDSEPQHRHQSHLFGLYPGTHITPWDTPELAEACRKTLEIKGDETTGWSKGWRINLWARLWDGERAYKMYRELLRYVDPDGMNVNYQRGGGTYPNLFDAHPPFQIDGNFGGAASVIEMLIQSDPGRIYLLPALPAAWKEGIVRGICARGGFEVSMVWKNHRLKESTITARAGGKTTLVYKDVQKEVELSKGQIVKLKW